ncbi:translocase of outer mitochondrial membrane [Malassezia vespertilionis]|uniref:Tom40p n=1 Tax=Malassezia vespertilionis TaxID=2020962 RepID=A0A2N1JD77_9BASI|nr:translocase of outer mitochondrial membrane [Malassezia vespertilionis]PKI84487.1 Tom40p [Malassezia vespertilionis]WFD06231.1 translocase of outer mitochondrial membrane [Malassezia vespertilionis]
MAEAAPAPVPVPMPHVTDTQLVTPSITVQRPSIEATLRSYYSALDPVLRPVTDAWQALRERRKALNLPNLGTVEKLQAEVKMVQTTNFQFEGARADLTKALSMNPIFQVTHAFTLAGVGKNAYNFGAVYGDNMRFYQAGLDDTGNVTMRLNRSWMPGHISKIQAQLAPPSGQTFVQMEYDWQGTDSSMNFKALNPSPVNGTGIYVANFLQTLTHRFAIGAEAVFQRPSPEVEEASIGYLAKLVGDKKDWIASAQWQPQGVGQFTYWQQLSEQVDVAADLQMIMMQQRRDAQATLSARYSFRMSSLRAQLDSLGKLSSVYEARISPAFAFTFSGEIDHLNGDSKFGLGVSIESGSEAMDPTLPPPVPPTVPM